MSHHIAWYIVMKVMVFWDMAPHGLIYCYEDYGVLGCDTMWFGMQV